MFLLGVAKGWVHISRFSSCCGSLLPYPTGVNRERRFEQSLTSRAFVCPNGQSIARNNSLRPTPPKIRLLPPFLSPYFCFARFACLCCDFLTCFSVFFCSWTMGGAKGWR